jgi:hypothetical protein
VTSGAIFVTFDLSDPERHRSASIVGVWRGKVAEATHLQVRQPDFTLALPVRRLLRESMMPGMADVERQSGFCGEPFMRLCLIHRFAGSENPLFDWLGKRAWPAAERSTPFSQVFAVATQASRESRNPARPPRLVASTSPTG